MRQLTSFVCSIAFASMFAGGCTRQGGHPIGMDDAMLIPGDAGTPDAVVIRPDAFMMMSEPDAFVGPDAGARDAAMTHDAGPPVCGNGVRETGELCDDSNTVGGDGCSATCTPDANCAMPDDLNTLGTADAAGILHYTGSNTGAASSLTGSCAGDGPEVVFQYTVPATGLLTLSTDNPGTDFDTALYVRRTCGDDASELACDDDDSASLSSLVALRVTAGDVLFVVVDSFDMGGTFELTAQTLSPRASGENCDPTMRTDYCSEGLVCSAATMGAMPTCHAGDLGCGSGVGVVDLTPLLDATGLVTYSNSFAIDSDTTMGSCSFTTPSQPEAIFSLTLPYEAQIDVNGSVSVLYARTACTDPHSELACDFSLNVDNLGPQPAGTQLFIFAEGTDAYEISVQLTHVLAAGAPCGGDTATMVCGTHLDCHVTAMNGTGTCQTIACGNGFAERGEDCDDGGLATGDGCDGTCHLEDQGLGGESCAMPHVLELVPVRRFGSEGRVGALPYGAHATGTTAASASDLSSPFCGGDASPDVVYQFTLDMPSDVEIDVTTSDPAYSPIVSLRGGMMAPCEASAGEIDCGMDSADATTYDTLDPGTYYIVVDGDAGSSGAYTLDVFAGVPFDVGPPIP